ncbi:MAG TPA: hypothetical protein VJV79_31005, partial [Polyangiaceae bacterium]|nr:hypothetical protein [Polyangiaceae bacterium]
MAASKKAPAKAPTTVKVEYFFCDNVNCNNHASFVVGTRPATSGLQSGGTCPQCHVGKISQLDLTQAANAPLVPNSIGVVLPALPYGGLPLRLGDEDAQSLWGGQTVNDPHHQGARYVGELQRDLLRLAFYGPARGGETFGRFSNHLMGSVLDFKHHLTTFYGIPTSDNLKTVQDGADAADKAERAQAAAQTPPSPPAGTGTAPTGAASAPSSAPANIPTSTFPIFFPSGGLANPAEVYNPVRSWVTSLGFPPGGVGTLQRTFETWAKLWETTNEPALKGKAPKPKDLVTRDERADLITGLLDSIKEQANDAEAAAAFLNGAPTAGKPDQAFVQLRNAALRDTNGWTQQAAPAIPAVPATPQTPAVPAVTAKSDGTIPKLLLRMTALEARWAALAQPLSPPPEWQTVKETLSALNDALVAYHDEIQKSDATTLMSAYLKLLQDFGQVDPGTARYIRRMAMDGVLNGQPVFRTPMGLPNGATGPTELVEFSSKDQAALQNEMDFVMASLPQKTAPRELIDFIFTHESGGFHSAKYGDRTFVKLGIDWNNTG